MRAILFFIAVAAYGQVATPLVIRQSTGSLTGELRLEERRTNGRNYVGWIAPQNIAASLTWELPAADGAAGYCLTATGAAGTAWTPCGSAEFDVRTYGAVCDGTTDDTAAIQAALDASVGIRALIHIPQGTCLVTTLDATDSYQSIRGQGKYVSSLQSVTDAPIFRIAPTVAKFYYLSVSELTLLGDSTSTSQYGIEVSGAHGWGNSKVENVNFVGLKKSIYDHNTHAIGSPTIEIKGCTFSFDTPAGIGIERDTLEGSVWMIHGNHAGGAAEAIGATSGNRFLYMHNFVGDVTANNNHVEGGWIAFDISCDNGTFATGACGYGRNFVVTGNKIDGYALDFRLYNISESDFTGNRGLGLDRNQMTSGGGGDAMENKFSPFADGVSNTATGTEMSGTFGGLSLNGYDSGRIRIGDTTSNISYTTNGVSIQDTGADLAIALGQSPTRNMGLLWDYNATVGNATGRLYTYSYLNPLLYGASYHNFDNGSVGIGRTPIRALDVNAEVARVGTTTADGANYLELGASATVLDNILLGSEDGAFVIYNGTLGGGGTVERMRIDDAGDAVISGFVTSPDGFTAIANSGSYVRARKVELHMDGTGTSFFSWLFSTANVLDLLDTASGVLARFDAATDDISFDGHVWPRGTTGTRNLGLTTARWLATNTVNLNLSGRVTSDLIPSGTRNLGSTGIPWTELFFGNGTVVSSLFPEANGGAVLGDATLRFSTVYTQALSSVGGVVTLLPGEAATIGDVWTATSTGGAGAWAAAGVCATCFLNGGNTTGATMFLGTNDAQSLAIETSATQRWHWTSSGHLYASSDNSYDIGSGGSNRPRNLYIAGTSAFGGDVTYGGSIASSMIPSANDTFILGSTIFRWGSIAGMDFNLGSGGSITVNGSAGLSVTKTVRSSDGLGTCTLIYVFGVLTGGTC